MVKSGVISSWIYQGSKCQLADTSEALKVPVIYQLQKQRVADFNKTMYRIVKDFVYHNCGIPEGFQIYLN
jgi:hypothetical protein